MDRFTVLLAATNPFVWALVPLAALALAVAALVLAVALAVAATAATGVLLYRRVKKELRISFPNDNVKENE